MTLYTAIGILSILSIQNVKVTAVVCFFVDVSNQVRLHIHVFDDRYLEG